MKNIIGSLPRALDIFTSSKQQLDLLDQSQFICIDFTNLVKSDVAVCK